MQFEELIDPKKFNIDDIEYYVGKIPAFYAQRILLKSGDALKDFDMTKLPEEVITDILKYTAVVNGHGEPITLDNLETVNLLLGHNTKALIAIEMRAITENFGFFLDGDLREIFEPIVRRMMGEQNSSSSTLSAAS